MKALWIIVAVVVFGALAVLALGRRDGAAPAPVADSGRALAELAPTATAPPTAPSPDEPVVATATEAAPAAPHGAGAVLPPAPAPAAAIVPSASPTQPAAAIVADAPPSMQAPAAPPSAAAGATAAPVVLGSTPALGQLFQEQPPATAAAPDDNGIEANPRFPADKLIPARVERKEGGVIVLDGRFPVRGSGTKEDPYRFSWDLLISAQESYKPRMGQMRLPQRVTMLDGKHVRIAGYVAFPITSANPREMLSMLNQWDGCCIGVPPTAYDAVEVKLAAAANAKQRMAVHGTVEGRLKVDPYLDGGWLLGLYLMEDAKLTIDE